MGAACYRGPAEPVMALTDAAAEEIIEKIKGSFLDAQRRVD